MLTGNTPNHLPEYFYCPGLPRLRIRFRFRMAAGSSPLRAAASYITKLPEAEHSAPEWQAAMEALILVAENGGPTMLVRIGVMRALNRGLVREFTESGKKHHRGQRRLKINEDLFLHRVSWPYYVCHDGRHRHANEAADFPGLRLGPICLPGKAISQEFLGSATITPDLRQEIKKSLPRG